MLNRNCCRHIPYMLFSPHLLFTDRSTCHVRTTQEVWWKASVTYIGKPWRWLWNVLWMTFIISCYQFVGVWCGLPDYVFRWHFHTLSSDLSDSNGRSPIYKWRMWWTSHRLQNQCKSNVFFQSIVVYVLSGCSVCIQANWSIKLELIPVSVT